MDAYEQKLSEQLLSLQKRLGYQFLDQSLLIKSFRHRKNNRTQNVFFDRLEKAGDAVLKSSVVALLMQKYPEASAGDLSRMESVITCNDNLAHLSTRLGLHEILWKSMHGQLTDKLIADSVEAILGAIALDAGGGCLINGNQKVFEICRKLFWVELETSRIQQPRVKLLSLLKKHGVHISTPPYRVFSRSYKNLPIGMVCRYHFKSKRLKALFGCDGFAGTGYSSDAAVNKTSAILILHLERETVPTQIPHLKQFSWKIKS